MSHETIGARIRAFRLRRGWSRHVLAGRIGVKHVTIWRYEHGDVVPSLRRIEQLARAFHITPATLLLPQRKNTCTACRDPGGVVTP
jgi:transcriptional regulator with XRE-family HTH domain